MPAAAAHPGRALREGGGPAFVDRGLGSSTDSELSAHSRGGEAGDEDGNGDGSEMRFSETAKASPARPDPSSNAPVGVPHAHIPGVPAGNTGTGNAWSGSAAWRAQALHSDPPCP